MLVSVFDLFKIGVGPSSSHTVGPMKAALRFVQVLEEAGSLSSVARVRAELYGSLALTGKGHGTDTAVMLGLSGQAPDTVDPEAIGTILAGIRETGRLAVGGHHVVPFDAAGDLVLDFIQVLPFHSNGMALEAYDGAGALIARRVFYSVGGGFIVSEEEAGRNADASIGSVDDIAALPYGFTSGAEMLAMGRRSGLSIAAMMMENEKTLRPEAEVRAGLDRLWEAMSACIDRGLKTEGVLPGGLKVKRRAPTLYRHLKDRAEGTLCDASAVMDWVNLYALAVSEENAAGGRVVTAPTNGAAGIIPATLRYFDRFVARGSRERLHDFLLTAAAIGGLYKRNASISGAEVGCQGEVGVACSMAAAGLAAALGATNEQIENAAEIGMEHNLGLTCDPVGGLVQVPCIERNALGAVKAINAGRIAMWGDGTHTVPLDTVIETMRQTGADMQTKYKETAQGGLAVNVVEC